MLDLLYWYKSGASFACLTGANVRVLTQRDGVQALQDKLLALQAKLADVEAYSRGRTSDLKDDTGTYIDI